MTDLEDFRNWSDGWLREGYYISYIRDGTVFYEHIIQRDLGHYVFDWTGTAASGGVAPTGITTGTESGPHVDPLFEITKGYDKSTNTNHIWQVIFGIKGEVYVYIELPTDLHRHGIPKRPKPGSTQWDVSHFTEEMSQFLCPTFITEHFMMRPETLQIAISIYNPNTITMTDVKINFFINKMVTRRIGTVANGVPSPSRSRFADLLNKLYRHQIPCRPITFLPVRAPAEAPGGE